VPAPDGGLNSLLRSHHLFQDYSYAYHTTTTDSHSIQQILNPPGFPVSADKHIPWDRLDNISWVTSRSTSQELRALARLLVLLIQHNSYQVPIPVFDYTSKQMLLAKAYNPWQTALLVSGFVETKASTTQRIHDDKLY